MYKVLLHESYTKRDLNGTVYHTIKVINPKNRQSFTVETPSSSNVDHILYEAFSRDSRSGAYPFYFTSAYTGSARLSSLPDHIYLDPCYFGDDWKKALNSIGYRIPKK